MPPSDRDGTRREAVWSGSLHQDAAAPAHQDLAGVAAPDRARPGVPWSADAGCAPSRSSRPATAPASSDDVRTPTAPTPDRPHPL